MDMRRRPSNFHTDIIVHTTMEDVWRTLPRDMTAHVLTYDACWIRMQALRRCVEGGMAFPEPTFVSPNSIVQTINRIDRYGQTYFHLRFKNAADGTSNETIVHVMSLDEKDRMHVEMDAVLRNDGLNYTPRRVLQDYHLDPDDDDDEHNVQKSSWYDHHALPLRPRTTSTTPQQYMDFIDGIKQKGDYYEHFLYNALFHNIVRHCDNPFISPIWDDNTTLPLNYIKTFMIMWYPLDTQRHWRL